MENETLRNKVSAVALISPTKSLKLAFSEEAISFIKVHFSLHHLKQCQCTLFSLTKVFSK